MNLLEQQTANRRRTWIVMAAFVAVVVLLGVGVDLFVVGGGDQFVPAASLLALGMSAGQAWWGLQHGDRSVLSSAQAAPVANRLEASSGDDRRLYRQFENIVEEMAIAGGLPKPEVWVIPDSDPNAFATGRDPEHASIAVTEGLLRTLNREELQGVVAHEMAHIRNYDIRLMTVVAALVGAVLLLSDWSTRMLRFGGVGRRRGRSRDRGGGGGVAALVLFAVWVVAVMLAPVMGRLLALAVSRRLEYLADATGAELTRNPLALARALEKIEAAVAPTPAIKRGSAHLCIADPMGFRIDKREGLWANLWATHPPMAHRIAALRAMGYEGDGSVFHRSGHSGARSLSGE
jgi:heat shock protein HtpX